MLTGLDQHFQLFGIERDRGAFLEQVAVELLQRHTECGGKLALVHRRPQRGKLVFQMFRVSALVFQQGGEAAMRDQAAVRSEERSVGKECVSKCRSRWSPDHEKKKTKHKKK